MLGDNLMQTNVRRSSPVLALQKNLVRKGEEDWQSNNPVMTSSPTQAEADSFFEISANTLRMIDSAVQDLNNGYVSKPIQLF